MSAHCWHCNAVVKIVGKEKFWRCARCHQTGMYTGCANTWSEGLRKNLPYRKDKK